MRNRTEDFPALEGLVAKFGMPSILRSLAVLAYDSFESENMYEANNLKNDLLFAASKAERLGGRSGPS